MMAHGLAMLNIKVQYQPVCAIYCHCWYLKVFLFGTFWQGPASFLLQFVVCAAYLSFEYAPSRRVPYFHSPWLAGHSSEVTEMFFKVH